MAGIALALAVALAYLTGHANAQVITGRVLHPKSAESGDTVPLPNVLCFASQPGAQSEPVSFKTWETAPAGWFKMTTSAGRYTHLDGETHQRVPFGCYKIGRVAAGEAPKFITNDVTHDPRVHNHEWARELGLVSFAGYRLLSAAKEPIGVLAFFGTHPVTPRDDALVEGLANTASQIIQVALAEEQLRLSKFSPGGLESNTDMREER